MNYTLSKSTGIAGADNSDGIARIKIPEVYDLNRALSGCDRTHNLQITNLTELPFGKGRRWPNRGGFLSNMQLNPDGSIRNLNGYAEVTRSYGERQLRVGLRLGF